MLVKEPLAFVALPCLVNDDEAKAQICSLKPLAALHPLDGAY